MVLHNIFFIPLFQRVKGIMCLYSFCIRHSDSSIFSKDILYARYWKLENTSHQIAATPSQSRYHVILSMFDLRYQRYSRHSDRLAGRVPTRSGHTLVGKNRRYLRGGAAPK
jgi:hypothetical protein